MSFENPTKAEMERTAKIVQRIVPDNVRMIASDDAELIRSYASTLALSFVCSGTGSTLMERADDASYRMHLWGESVFLPHAAKEEAQCAEVNEKASRAMPLVTKVSIVPSGRKMSILTVTDSRTPNPLVASALLSDDGTWTAYYPVAPFGIEDNAIGSGATPDDAFKSAVTASGAMLR